jgi:DNA-directed RNA polymerase specialized sigma24 family protein
MSISQRYIVIGEQQVPVTEEVYRAYKRPAWAERKRKERQKRCRDENGNRCVEDCRHRGDERTGRFLSLDRFLAEGFEIADPVNLAEMVAEKMLLEELNKALKELEPEERSLIEAIFYDGRTERDYADEIGLLHQSVNKRKQKIMVELRRHMSHEK